MGPSVALPETGDRARCRILVEGIVQGVGFRPSVYRLAEAHRLGGSVRNGQHGVLIDAEGDRDSIARFLDELQSTAPSSARLGRITVTWATPHHDADVIVRTCGRLRERSGLAQVALSGGVFQNVRLFRLAVDGLSRTGFQVYTHHQVPPNDGGLALRQAAIAARLQEDRRPA